MQKTDFKLIHDSPRVKIAAGTEAFPAAHPFFWAGYLLVDTGSTPAEPAK